MFRTILESKIHRATVTHADDGAGPALPAYVR